ncbi:J domain-containing protein [Paraburkholderia nemoris]|uniref:J domain-containing protein n=1 Tax=Paraburkholderia nemoris TaxID=2793076 RepID=UPI0038B79236
MKWTNLDLGYKNRLDTLRRLSPYELLGIGPDASMDEVKRAFRLKVRLYHPDQADAFMRTHGEEVTKLLNLAMQAIERDRKK